MRGRQGRPVFLRGESDPFPDPRLFDREGLVAIGGELTTDRLLLAYRSGVFPWYAEGILPMWWSPDPRGLMSNEALHVGRSLRQTLQRADFTVTWNKCFARVMAECGKHRPEGTWVIPEMLRAYERLHRAGAAHSLEVWQRRALVGGIYGVQVGALFAAESMFHRRTDMSKVALVAMVRTVCQAGIEVFDVQFVTSHLRSLGAFEVGRADYLLRIAQATAKPVMLKQALRDDAWRRD